MFGFEIMYLGVLAANHFVQSSSQGRSNLMPQFKWTGELRPYRVGPRRHIPEAIPGPDWQFSGLPIEEQRSKD